jgi:prophage endopeptidase
MNSRTLIIIAALLASGLTWWVEGIRWDKDVATLNEAHTAEQKKQSDQAVINLTEAQKRTEAAQQALSALDAKHTKELADEQSKNDRLRADVAAGSRRVRIAAANLATCQLVGDSITPASGVGNAAQVELSGAGGRVVLDLRAGAIKDDQVIQYLQGYITEAQKYCNINSQ